MPKKGKEKFQDFINNLKIGDMIVFPLKGAFFSIRGEVRDFYFSNKRFYLIIYSFLKREEFTYILTEDLYLLTPREDTHPETPVSDFSLEYFLNNPEFGSNLDSNFSSYAPFSRQTEIEDLEEATPPFTTFFSNSRVKKVLALIVIITMLYPFLNYLISPLYAFLATNYSYKEFLKKDFALTELIEVVRLRIHYRNDVFDEWETPASAWQKRAGDCEEMAALCAAYLEYHKATCYLVGLQTKKLNTGHAVVFLKSKNSFYILDPTKAIETEGFKALSASITCLREAIRHYTPIPAIIYKIPTFNSEKKALEIVDQ